MAKGVVHADPGSQLTYAEYIQDGSHTLQSGTSFPGTPSEMDLYYRTDEHKWYVYNGSAWTELTSQGTTTFLGLTDTPSVYTGSAGYMVAVNSTPNALEFVAKSSIDHGAWGGQGDDDHTQYLLASCARAFAGNLIPDGSNTRDIGSTTAELKDIYIAGRVYLFTDQYENIRSSGTAIVFAVDNADELSLSGTALYPNTNAGLNLGSSSNRFDLGYFTTSINITHPSVSPYIILTGVAATEPYITGQVNSKNIGVIRFNETSNQLKLTTPNAAGTWVDRLILPGWTDDINITIQDAHLLPTDANAYNLGSAANEWANLYIGTGSVFFYTDQGESISSDGSKLIQSATQFSGSAYFGSTTYYINSSGVPLLNIAADDATYTGIVTSDSGVLKYRTKAEILSDIGAEGTLTKGDLTANAPISVSVTRQVIGGAAAISHSTSAGYIHLPTGGTGNQILKNSGASGTGAWGTVTENAGALASITTISMSNQLTNTLAIGTAPFIITSTTLVSNLNADLLDNQEGSYYATAANLSTHVGGTAYAQHTGGLGTHTHQSAGAEGDKIDHGLALNGLGDDDHTQYLLASGTRAFTGSLVPNASGTLNIGSTTAELQHIYLTGSVYLYADQAESIRSDGTNIILRIATVDELLLSSSSLYPNVDAGLDIGTTANRFATLFVDDITCTNPPWSTVTTFLGLTDTPSAYTGAGGYFVKVNSTPNALEFVNVTSMTPTAHALAVASGYHTSTLPLTDLAVGTQGSIIRRGAADWEEYTLGTLNYVLKAGATDVAWGQVAWGEVTGKPSSFTPSAHALATVSGYHTGELALGDLAAGSQGSIIYRDATDWTELAKGANTYVLKSGTTTISWSTVDWSELTGTQPPPVSHTLQSHTGDLAYTQLDTIVDTSGVGTASYISAATHVHTDADGSSKVTYSNLSGIPSSFTPSAHVLATTGPHTDTLPVSDMSFNASVIPTATTYDLGSATYEWANLYIGTGRVYFSGDQGESIRSDGTNVIFAVNTTDELVLAGSALYPYTTKGLDLGSSSNYWNNIHAQGHLSLGSEGTISAERILYAWESYTGSNDALGIYVGSYLTGSGTSSTITGLYALGGAYNNSNVLANAVGVKGYAYQGGTGSTTNAYSLYAEAPTGAITNAYGLYIQNVTAGSSLNYSLFVAGGTTSLGGNLYSNHHYPNTADTYNLGSATAEWANMYIGTGALYFGTSQSASLAYNSNLGEMQLSGHLKTNIIGIPNMQGFYGELNNYLSWAHLRCTITASESPDIGITDNMFNGDHYSYARWDTATTSLPLTIEIDGINTGIQQHYWRYFGIVATGLDDFKIETYNTNIADWETVVDVTDSPTENYMMYANTTFSYVSKIRYTINSINGTDIRIRTLAATPFAPQMYASPILTKAGGKIYGTLFCSPDGENDLGSTTYRWGQLHVDEIVLDHDPDADHTAGAGSTIFESQTAGEALVFGNLVYLKLSDNKWWKTDANAEATSTGKLGLVLETIAADGTGKILIWGTAEDASWTWATAGSSQPIFISETAGGLTTTAPTTSGAMVRIIGHTIAATRVSFTPDGAWAQVT